MSHDTWMHRLTRRAVRPLADTPVTPNHLTTARLATGLGAAICLAPGTWFWTVTGAILFVLSVLLDRADGELARLTGKTSEWGHVYDLVADGICDVTILVGIGFAARHGALGWWAVPMSVLAGVSVAAIFVIVLRLEAQFGRGAGQFQASAGFDPDDAIVLVPIAALAGWHQPLVIAAAVCAPAALVLVSLELRRRRASLEAPPGAQAEQPAERP